MTVSLITGTITIALLGLTFIMIVLGFLTKKTTGLALISLALTVVSICAFAIAVIWELSVVL